MFLIFRQKARAWERCWQTFTATVKIKQKNESTNKPVCFFPFEALWLLFQHSTGLTSTYLPSTCISNCFHSLFPCCSEFLSPRIPFNVKIFHFFKLQPLAFNRQLVSSCRFFVEISSEELLGAVSLNSLASHSAAYCPTIQKFVFKNKNNTHRNSNWILWSAVFLQLHSWLYCAEMSLVARIFCSTSSMPVRHICQIWVAKTADFLLFCGNQFP